jgi:hypothetical protein
MSERLPVLSRRVGGFRMFGLKDELERGYWEVPLLYPASLLYMVSGLFEETEVDMPIVGMQRYFAGVKPYDKPDLRQVAEWIGARSVWSRSEGAIGLNSGAERHGGFDEDVAARESLKHILQHGF